MCWFKPYNALAGDPIQGAREEVPASVNHGSVASAEVHASDAFADSRPTVPQVPGASDRSGYKETTKDSADSTQNGKDGVLLIFIHLIHVHIIGLYTYVHWCINLLIIFVQPVII